MLPLEEESKREQEEGAGGLAVEVEDENAHAVVEGRLG